MMTKQSEHIITPFFSKYVNTPSQVVATLSMSADLMYSMPMHLSEESEPVQSTQLDVDMESQGKK